MKLLDAFYNHSWNLSQPMEKLHKFNRKIYKYFLYNSIYFHIKHYSNDSICPFEYTSLFITMKLLALRLSQCHFADAADPNEVLDRASRNCGGFQLFSNPLEPARIGRKFPQICQIFCYSSYLLSKSGDIFHIFSLFIGLLCLS